MGCCNNRDNRGDVLGAFDEDFKVKVKAFVDGEDFCRGVRRCLLNDLVAGALDDDRKRHRRRGSWI